MLSIEMFNCKRAPNRGAIGTRDSVANGVVVSWRGMTSCWSSCAPSAKRCSSFEFLLMEFVANRPGNIDAEEKPFIGVVLTARGAKDVVLVVLNKDRRVPAGRTDCVRCARARDGKLAIKTTKARNRLLERNIGPRLVARGHLRATSSRKQYRRNRR